jgi:methyl-accepting chemotaxis protein
LPILSSQALKETTQLIAGSLEKMEAGTAVANQTSLSLKGILDEFEKVAALVGDVAGVSNDQALFIAQINRGIEEVSMVVQTNSAKPNKVPPLAKNSRHRRNYLYKWFVPLRLEQFK